MNLSYVSYILSEYRQSVINAAGLILLIIGKLCSMISFMPLYISPLKKQQNIVNAITKDSFVLLDHFPIEPRKVPLDTPIIEPAKLVSNINPIFEAEDSNMLNDGEQRFLEDSRRATTDTAVRTRRTEYLIDLILQ